MVSKGSNSERNQRVALVTGGSRGIGREICYGLGHVNRKVAVCDVRTEEAAETAQTINDHGGEAIAVEMDVASAESVHLGIERIIKTLGPVEVLVNCAGLDEIKPFLLTDETFWNRVIEVNYKGTLRTVHECLPAMIEAGWGRIVNIGSDSGRVGSSFEAVTSGTKGAVIAFTKTIAKEVAEHGITANTVCPGATATSRQTEIVATRAKANDKLGDLASQVPMKRVGQPDEVASAVIYFCSDEAGFVSGQTLSVSGGLTMA